MTLQNPTKYNHILVSDKKASYLINSTDMYILNLEGQTLVIDLDYSPNPIQMYCYLHITNKGFYNSSQSFT